MTPIEQINFETQIAKPWPAPPSREKTMSVLLAENETLRAQFEAASQANRELVKQINEASVELDRANVWYNVSKKAEGENKILSDKLNQFDELLNRRRQQVKKLRDRIREDGLKAYNQGLELKRLKRRVNELIRGRKAKRKGAAPKAA